MKRIITRYPVFPAHGGAEFDMPAGADILSVSMSIHQYFVHALVDPESTTYEKRRIAAYLDDTAIKDTDADIGVYIGSCRHIGEVMYHFFDQGII